MKHIIYAGGITNFVSFRSFITHKNVYFPKMFLINLVTEFLFIKKAIIITNKIPHLMAYCSYSGTIATDTIITVTDIISKGFISYIFILMFLLRSVRIIK